MTLSRTYSANVRRMIIEAERDVSRIDYLTTLRPELSKASRHLERRIQVDGTFLRHLEGLRSDASEEQDPEAVRQLTVAASRLGEAVETLAELHTDVIGATPRWRDAQAAQSFTAVPADRNRSDRGRLVGSAHRRPAAIRCRHHSDSSRRGC